MTTIKLTVLALLFFAHWFGDFVCQTRWMAENKSKNYWALLLHVAIYTLVVGIIMTPCAASAWGLATFITLTWLTHFIIDMNTSQLNARLWRVGRVHAFWMSVGFDQYLHALSLIWTVGYLLK